MISESMARTLLMIPTNLVATAVAYTDYSVLRLLVLPMILVATAAGTTDFSVATAALT